MATLARAPKGQNVKSESPHVATGAADGHDFAKEFLTAAELAALLEAAKAGRHGTRDHLIFLTISVTACESAKPANETAVEVMPGGQNAHLGCTRRRGPMRNASIYGRLLSPDPNENNRPALLASSRFRIMLLRDALVAVCDSSVRR